MAATIRVARIVGTSQPGQGKIVATGRGAAGGGIIRVAEIQGQSVRTAPIIRVAAIQGISQAQGAAVIRVAEITGVSVTAQYVWDNSQWIPVTPDNVGYGRITATGSGSLTPTTGQAGAGVVHASGRGGLAPIYSGSVTISAASLVTESGAVNPSGPSGQVTLTVTAGLTLLGSQIGGKGPLGVTPDPGNSPPRMILTLTGASGPTATIYRIDQSGRKTPVRGANPATLNAAGWVGFDYEAPFGQPVTYQVVTSAATTVTDPFTLDPRAAWLIHPGIPALSQPLTGVTIGEFTTGASQAVQYAIGRANPAVNGDGVRHAPTFPLTVKTATFEGLQGMRTLLADGSALLLQIAYPFTPATEYWWVSLGDVVEGRRTRDFGDPRRVWQLPCTVTDPPSGLLQAQRTWADVLAEFDTWGDVLAVYDTWRDVITGNRNDQ